MDSARRHVVCGSRRRAGRRLADLLGDDRNVGSQALRVPSWPIFLVSLVFALPVQGGERLALDGATVEACFTPGSNCAGIVADAILAARERVWLLGYGFSESGILDALKEIRSRGLDGRLILDRSNDDGGGNSGATYMAKLGVPVLIDRSVRIAHNKLILIDRDTGIMGSLNWTTAAIRRTTKTFTSSAAPGSCPSGTPTIFAGARR